MKVEGVEYDLVMLDEFEYAIEFPPRFSGKDEYKISILDFSRFLPVIFTRKFSRLPKDFQRAVLLMNIRYEAGGLKEFGGDDFGMFRAVLRAQEWEETVGDLEGFTWDVGGNQTLRNITINTIPLNPPIQHGPSFYIKFRTGKYPASSYTKMYPTKKEYEQMKKERKTNGKIKKSVVVLGFKGV